MKSSRTIATNITKGPSKYLLKNSVLFWIVFLTTAAAYAQDPFITTWKTDNATTNTTSITIPTTGTGYNYEVDWDNDGTYDQSGITGNVTHDYGAEGTYTIRIRGNFPRIYFYLSNDAPKLVDVVQWGDIAWTSMEFAFRSCSKLNINATDVPDLSRVTSLNGMFYGCSILNGPANINTWNTVTIRNMSQVFFDATSFNQPIGGWNTAAVTTMYQMFCLASSFNQPIGAWNTRLVTDMTNMFARAISFNQPIGSWKLENRALLDNMLSYSGMDCNNYSSTLNGWASNPATSSSRSLGAYALQYGTSAMSARATLITTKGWTITGDAPSGQDCAATLPVTLISFTGKQQGDAILLTWQTALEKNNAGFEIEKSTDGKTFERIGFVDGNVDSDKFKTYRFTDAYPFSMNYYRLKQIDRAAEHDNGKSEYSRIISIKGPGDSFGIYPNPAQDDLYLRNRDGNYEVLISDMTGNPRLKTTTNGLTPINISDLPSGVFFVKIGGETQKLAIQR